MALPKPYYQDSAVTIYHGDCREILALLPTVNLVLTDPPYGLGTVKKGGGISKLRNKNQYATFEDTRENVRLNVVPAFEAALKLCPRAVLTPGPRCLVFYPVPADLGVIYQPASVGASPWGHPSGQPIFYYGKDPYPMLFRKTSWVLTEAPPKNGHPCVKPTRFYICGVEPSEVNVPLHLGYETHAIASSSTRRAIREGRTWVKELDHAGREKTPRP